MAAAVPFYGVYDMLDEDVVYYEGLRSWLLEEIVIKRRRPRTPRRFGPSSPTHRVHAEAPPFLVFHGERDTLVPPADARAFASASKTSRRTRRLFATPRRRARLRPDAVAANRTRRRGSNGSLRGVVAPPGETGDAPRARAHDVEGMSPAIRLGDPDERRTEHTARRAHQPARPRA